MRCRLGAALALALAVMLAPAARAEGGGSAPPAPPNDARAAAQAIHSLPASIEGTTVGASLEAGEVESQCHAGTTNSVWYSLRLTSAHRVGLDLDAAGALDATIDVYHAVRSQLSPVECQQTDAEGKASFSFRASKNGLYYIRVAALGGSQQNSFSLEAYLPTPAVKPPGAPLPSSGVSGQVDRIQNVNAAYSLLMRAGQSYIVNLANETKGACVSATLFAPGTRSFGGEEEGEREGEGGGGGGGARGVARIQCGGYRLFTPGPGKGGLYSLNVTPDFSHRGVQRFHLQVVPAGPAETAPGVALGNYVRARGYLNGRAAQVIRLYRMEIRNHSNLTLKLTTSQAAKFHLQLRNQDGDVIGCQCEGSGPKTLTHQLRAGTYYAVVSEQGGSSGGYTLLRQSRTITSTSIAFSAQHAAPGEALTIDVHVTPAVSGPVSVQIERFDPVFGWQFYREAYTFASSGVASVPFTPPAVGRWRAKANYLGSRTASPSAVGHTYLVVG